MTATTTRLMRTGAMCSGAPGAWAPSEGESATAHGIGENPSAVVVPGNPFLR